MGRSTLRIWGRPSEEALHIDQHVCVPPDPQSPGDEYTCACRARWVAVRRRWWSRRLRWARVLFSVPCDEPVTGRDPAWRAPRESG